MGVVNWTPILVDKLTIHTQTIYLCGLLTLSANTSVEILLIYSIQLVQLGYTTGSKLSKQLNINYERWGGTCSKTMPLLCQNQKKAQGHLYPT
jgi:hypothetical protein